ncbi:MAG: glycoside hydrolase family 13 protein [Chloroflexi bacterium]|nr:glycoside hydrolase family 13 protein [Chloroflexota bacterium]
MSIETPDWVKDAVFYQIFPDRFAQSSRVPKPGRLESWDSPPTRHGFKGGDLLGVAEHLDYLQDLGVTAIYFNPIFQSASNHRYHTYDYMAVDPLLGGDAALRELIDAAHGRAMRVVLDGVFNHASRGFWPFHHVMETGSSSPYRQWFHFDEGALEAGRTIRAYPEREEPLDTTNVPDAQRAGEGSMEAFGYRAWWNLPALPKLNTDNPEVREYLFSVAEHWIRFGADGWRLDVALEIADGSFWQEFRRRVKAVRPDAYIVAEVWHEEPRYLQGDRFDAYMNYPWAAAVTSFVGGPYLDRRVLRQHFGLDETIRGIDAEEFARRLERNFSVYDPAVVAVQLNLLDTHDTPRFLTIAGHDSASLRLATIIQMTCPGAPSIYYGDEIGLRGEQDPGSRGAFPWDRPETWDHDLLAFVRGAVAARHANPVLRRGSFRVAHATGPVIGYLRAPVAGVDGAATLVAINVGHDDLTVEIDVPELDAQVFEAALWAGMPDANPERLAIVNGRVAVRVPARSGVVLQASIA